MSSLRIALSLSLSMAAACALAQVPQPGAGRVQFATGDVRILGADNREKPARKGESVNEGDTVTTAPGAAAQLAMSDGGVIAVRPESRLVIQNFRFEGREDGTERSVISLLRGGFRTITGIVGRRNRDTYRVVTPTATIGIRGTDHEIVFIPVPAAGESTPGEPGTYNKVNVGETFVQNERGSVVVGANQVAFAGVRPDLAPVRLDRVPDFLRATPPPQGRAAPRPMRETAAADNRGLPGRVERAGAAGPLLPGPRPLLDNRIVQTAVVSGGGALNLADPGAGAGGLAEAPFGTAIVGGMFAPTVLKIESGGLAIDGGAGKVVLLDAARNPVLIADVDGFRFTRDGAPLVDSGTVDVNGSSVRWGVYAGGTILEVDKGQYSPAFFHFMGAANASTPAELVVPGSATFSTVAAFTKPVDEQGRLGGNVLLNVAVQFGAAPKVTSYNLQVQDAGGRNWSGTLVSPQSLGTFATGQAVPNLSVTCGGGCARSGIGDATGYVIGGAARNGMITSYTLKTVDAAVTGSVAVK